MSAPSDRQILITNKRRIADADICVVYCVLEGALVDELRMAWKDGVSATVLVNLVADVGIINAVPGEATVAGTKV